MITSLAEVHSHEVGEPTSSPLPDASPEPRAEPMQSLAAAINEATPARREAIKRDLSRSIAGELECLLAIPFKLNFICCVCATCSSRGGSHNLA